MRTRKFVTHPGVRRSDAREAIARFARTKCEKIADNLVIGGFFVNEIHHSVLAEVSKDVDLVAAAIEGVDFARRAHCQYLLPRCRCAA